MSTFNCSSQVAELCNHQRAVSKGHQASMEKMQEKLEAIRDEVEVRGMRNADVAGRADVAS